MKGSYRPRRLASLASLAVVALAIAACSEQYPNTTFDPHSEFGRDIDFLWDRMLLLGTIVFVLVEAALLFVVFKYRRRTTDVRPPQTHGNAVLEVIWTLIPAFILLFIAVPTVRIIFKTQAKVAAGALEVEVIGHQWWWEFRYPQYGITTANEIYIPTGRTVNFKLTSQDVIHSFWVPQLGGKRDAITNRTNYIWFTPDSTMEPAVWNGFCTEYCGDSHANMRFRVFTVRPNDFASWVAQQQKPAAFGATAAVASRPGTPGAATAPLEAEAPTAGTGAAAGRSVALPRPVGSTMPGIDTAAASAPIAAMPVSNVAAGYTFPRNQAAFDYARPQTPTPSGLTFTKGLTGNAARGQQIYSAAACIGCHSIAGNPASVGVVGPNLTHFGSRSTIGAGTFPNTPAYLALWIKNTPRMKPGSLMPTLGKNQVSPQTRQPVTTGGLDDQQIADIVAYLTVLK